jgi:HAD superfamily hydrolase (TIGR01484 family)
MKLWKPEEFDRYVQAMLELKRSATGRTRKVRRAIEAALTRIYRAVAFDIDGTLTLPGSEKVDPQTAQAIGRLLQRGVPVLLTTGRSQDSCRKAAEQIRENSGLSNWVMRRLQCITDNGCYLLQTPIDKPEALLHLRKPWVDGPLELSELVERLRAELARHPEARPPEVELETDPYAVRMTFSNRRTRREMEKIVRRLVGQMVPGKVFITHGRYADRFCLDLTVTHKQAALDKLLKVMDISPDTVLRLGDHGAPRGNDYLLLASAAGFSVGALSPNPLQCYPVLADSTFHQLKGSAATNKLLSEIRIFAPLSIDVKRGTSRDSFADLPESEKVKRDTFTELREFERIALTRSRQEKETVTQRVRVRLRYMLEDPQTAAELHYLDLSDIFDDQSGGVRFREWELERLHPHREISELFDLPSPQKKDHLRWCMYTDTGILMRGPNYYFGETDAREEAFFERFLNNARCFVDGAIATTRVLSKVEADLFQFKAVLAIQDNIRNILLQLLHVFFVVEGAQARPCWGRTRDCFLDLVAAHSEAQYKFLLNPDAEWATVLPVYSSLLCKIWHYLLSVPSDLASGLPSEKPNQKLFKWRECDNFLQNVAAVQLGLHELRQQREIREAEYLLIIGLVHGGIELPGIALAIATARGFRAACGLLDLSIYSDATNGRRVRREVRAGTLDYVRPFLAENKPFCMLDPQNQEVENAITIVVDDNCTTCLTLQVARDVLVTLGADVAGSVVVRFAGMNRHARMAERGDVPDPKVLFSFIRGLVAPSPQMRIGPGSKHSFSRDPTKAFDKSRRRIERYLKRNRTPVVLPSR